jgi:hypothetical protein
MSGGPHRLFAGFNGKCVEVECDSAPLLAVLTGRLGHLIVKPQRGAEIVLHMALGEFAPSCLEVRDSTGRAARGSPQYVLHLTCKWITAAFASAHPDLLWLHAAAASHDGFGILLAGAAGAGKSTLVTRLISHAWRLLADDAVPLQTRNGTALPFPINPDLRTPHHALEDNGRAFLERPKVVVAVPAEQVALVPAAVGTIVFPDFISARASSPELQRLTVIRAAQEIAAHCLFQRKDRLQTLSAAFRLSGRVPCYRLVYGDATAAAARLVRRWSSTSEIAMRS